MRTINAASSALLVIDFQSRLGARAQLEVKIGDFSADRLRIGISVAPCLTVLNDVNLSSEYSYQMMSSCISEFLRPLTSSPKSRGR